MSSISEIVKATVKRMTSEGLVMTPEEYGKIFCQEAKKAGFKLDECDKLPRMLEKLDPATSAAIKKYTVRTVDELVVFLSSRLKSLQPGEKKAPAPAEGKDEKFFADMARLVGEGLIPSISLVLRDETESLQKKLTDNPHLLASPQTQKELERFIEKRVVFDRKEVRDEMKVIDKMVDEISTRISGAVTQHKKTDEAIGTLRHEFTNLKFVQFSDKKIFDPVHEKLLAIIEALQLRSREMSQTLTENQGEVDRLKQKVEALEEKVAKAKEESLRDPLSGLLNRRGWEIEAGKLESRFVRFGEDYCVAAFDLDNFKAINDTYGHEAGDVVIRTFGTIMTKEVRSIDVTARLGGEEFSAAFPATGPAGGIQAADKLRDAVQSTQFMFRGERMAVTVSGGIVLRGDYDSLAEAMRGCDLLLYEAKRQGKNRIVGRS